MKNLDLDLMYFTVKGELKIINEFIEYQFRSQSWVIKMLLVTISKYEVRENIKIDLRRQDSAFRFCYHNDGLIYNNNIVYSLFNFIIR